MKTKYGNLWTLAAAASIIAASVNSVASAADEIIYPEQGSAILLGSGINSLTRRDLDRCIQAQNVTTLGNAGASDTQFDLIEINDREQLRRSLDLDASASFGMGSFGASAKAKYWNEQSFDSNSYYLMVRVQVRNQTQVLSNFEFTPAANAIRQNKQAFYDVCGDSFVVSTVSGGEFLAIIRLQTTEGSQREELKASFKASYLAAKADGDARKRVDSSYSKYNGQISIIRTGQSEAMPDFREPSALLDYAIAFPTKVNAASKAAWTYSVKIKPYSEIIASYGSDYVSLKSPKAILEQLAQKHSVALQKYEDIQFVLNHSDLYDSPDLNALAKAADQLGKVVANLREAARGCDEDAIELKSCVLPSSEDTKFPDITIPKRKSLNVVYIDRPGPECGFDHFETKTVYNSCRRPENGIESTKITPMDYGTEDEECEHHARRAWPQLYDSDPNEQATQVQELTKHYQNPRGHSPRISGPSDDYGPNPLLRTCRVSVRTMIYINAPNAACGSHQEPDTSKPVFKSCRHPSHGVEGEGK